MGGSGSNGFQGYLDKEVAARALKEKLNEDLTLQCTILRKKIKSVNGDKDQIERVLFCSDHRQIKGFNKRKHKHEVKTKRTKKTTLKEKMQSSKSLLESGGDHRDRKSESSSIVRLSTSHLQQPLDGQRGTRTHNVGSLSNFSQPVGLNQNAIGV